MLGEERWNVKKESKDDVNQVSQFIKMISFLTNISDFLMQKDHLFNSNEPQIA